MKDFFYWILFQVQIWKQKSIFVYLSNFMNHSDSKHLNFIIFSQLKFFCFVLLDRHGLDKQTCFINIVTFHLQREKETRWIKSSGGGRGLITRPVGSILTSYLLSILLVSFSRKISEDELCYTSDLKPFLQPSIHFILFIKL